MTLNSRPLLFCILMMPAVPMLWPLAAADAPWRTPIRPTGEAAALLLISALAVTPVHQLFPVAAWSRWLVRQRRAIGLAAFAYAAIHMIAFSLAIGRLDHILQGMAWASMWTGWLAFTAMLALAVISNDHALRALGRWWKRMQRLAYPAVLAALAHWLLLTRSPGEALLWFLPLVLLQSARLVKTVRRKWMPQGRVSG